MAVFARVLRGSRRRQCVDLAARRDRLDVNLILFALWLGVSGRGRLDGEALTAAGRVAHEIGTEIVQPLRALRRNLARMIRRMMYRICVNA